MVRILLAEDDHDLRRFLKKALERAGHEVFDFDNGEDAWQALQDLDVELLLTDIVMPLMDGIELARKAAQRQPGMRIMFITGFAAVALTPERAAPSNATVLSKPFHLRQLVAEVERLMAA